MGAKGEVGIDGVEGIDWGKGDVHGTSITQSQVSHPEADTMLSLSIFPLCRTQFCCYKVLSLGCALTVAV